jgi:hypothetical protein
VENPGIEEKEKEEGEVWTRDFLRKSRKKRQQMGGVGGGVCGGGVR